MHKLDNPTWNALSTRHKDLSLGNELARRYKPEFTSLAGVREPSSEAFAALAKYVQPGEKVGVATLEAFELPPGWSFSAVLPLCQMICEKQIECPTQTMVVLSTADIPEMLTLTKLTQPGPFAERTIEFGTFYGIRSAIEDGGRLVAMAGERMKIDGGYDEVSAVCTHPDFQGKGMARALVQAVTKNIIERGATPVLHVLSTNESAIRSYKSIGYTERKQMVFNMLCREAD